MRRRAFLRTGLSAVGILGLGGLPLSAIGRSEVLKLTILHTNDVHSRIDPFPTDGGPYAGQGGILARESMIRKIRTEEQRLLLLDAGDVFQGTPYFNLFGGEIELKAMAALGYDAATLGNHDFDGGLKGLVKVLPHANFPFLNVNYSFDNTPLEGRIKPYKIFDLDGLRVGVFGVGIELEGLVPPRLYGDVQYQDPVQPANATARWLRYEEDCDFVICLSHLGYKSWSDQIKDPHFAAASEEIDLILGGHSHTFMEKPDIVRNTKGHPVIINQVGWGGLVLGRLDFYFEKRRSGTPKMEATYDWVS
ncbi:MAG: metallophosphatase [Bacteroidota bacterium]